MLARYTGATLALFAFAVAITAGLFAQNPPTVILSRAVLALFTFLFLGLILGYCAQLVIRDFERKREDEIDRRYGEASTTSTEGGGDDPTVTGPAEPARA